MQFDAVGELIHTINTQLSIQTNRERINAIRTGINFENLMNDNFQDKTKTVQETVEENLVNDIINGDNTNYRPGYTFTQPKTEQEITDLNRQDNINFIESELAKNARDFEIVADIEAAEKADLIREILDPSGIITNEDVSSLDAIRNINGESTIPNLDPIALRGMERFLHNLKDTIEISDDEPPDEDVKPPPQAVYAPLIDLTGPNLQDILTNDNQNSEILDEIRSVRDTIKIEVEDISSPPPPDDFPGDFDDTEFEDNNPPQPPFNPFGGASAPPFPDINSKEPSAPPYTDDRPPPYPDVDPPDYDDLFPPIPPEPVPIRNVPLLSSDEESNSDEPQPPPAPDPRLIYTLVPPEVGVDSDNEPGDLIGNPNVNVILPLLQGDPNFTPAGNPNFNPNPDWTDEEDVEDPGYNDDDIDFVVTPVTNTPITADENTTTGSLLYKNRKNELYRRAARRRALNILAKKNKRNLASAKKYKRLNQIIPEFNNEKIIVDSEGEVTIDEPENAQINYDTSSSVVPYYNEVIELNDTPMPDVRTKNIVLKRKHPKDDSITAKKYIAGTDIVSRSIWDVGAPVDESLEISDDDDKNSLIEISGDDEPEIADVKPFVNNSGLATVDIHTMRKMPWVDFSIILQENDAERREQVIMDLLQNNMPDSNDQYYIYHNQETNHFSVELDEDADELRDLVERVRVIDAKLKIEYLTAKERKSLKKIKENFWHL